MLKLLQEEWSEKDLEPGGHKKPLPEPLSPLEKYLLQKDFSYIGQSNDDEERIYTIITGPDGKKRENSHYEGGLVFNIRVVVVEEDRLGLDKSASMNISRYMPDERQHGGGWRYDRIFDGWVPYSYTQEPVQVGPRHTLGDKDNKVSLKHTLKVAFDKFEQAKSDMVDEYRHGTGTDGDLSEWDF
tara:strand:- start:415 stop:969 length:555 start_codon:yes stop_codon:yes gene_type:complete